jgi:predicted RNase H-like HicB family nuclease
VGGTGGKGSCGGQLNRYSSNMKLPKLTAVIEKEESWFIAHCPELGVTSQGRTISEAEAMIQEAVDLFLECADEAEVRRRLERGVLVKELEPAHA